MLVYLDSAVTIAYAYGPSDNNFHSAERVFKDIISSKYRGVISHLALSETLNVFRRKAARLKELTILKTDEQICQYVQTKSFETYKTFIEKLLEIPSGYVEFIEESRIGNTPLFKNAFDLLLSKPGKVRRAQNGWEHNGLSPADVLHVHLAKAIGCDELVTTDNGFRELESDPSFAPLRIRIL